MITLNNYLYGYYTVPEIVRKYGNDLRQAALQFGNEVDRQHSSFLLEYLSFIDNNKFLLRQETTMYEYFKALEEKNPFLAFTLKGRVKSLLRTEEKYNAYIMEFVEKYYHSTNSFPSAKQINDYLERYNDLIAYRLVINIPKSNLPLGRDKEEVEIEYLYKICNDLPRFFQERGFDVIPIRIDQAETSPLLNEENKGYFKDYIANPKGEAKYRSLHICLFDLALRIKFEIQIRTKNMDDYAEIGLANHQVYEKYQNDERKRSVNIQKGKCIYYDEASERVMRLQALDYTEIQVDMFTCYNTKINDSSGLLYPRIISPYESL